jgi:hypothetical protein
MKDHQIAILVNALAHALSERFPMLPKCLREIIRSIVMENLKNQKLLIDHQEK